VNPARARNHKPESGPSLTFTLKPDSGLNTEFSEGVNWDMRNCGVSKNIAFESSWRYTVYHTQNNNRVDQNIDII